MIGIMTAVSSSNHGVSVLTCLGVVSFVFLSALAITWCLKKIGGRLSANVDGKVKKRGWSLMLSGKGLIGSYLAVVIAEFVGLYFTGWMMRSW